MRYFRVFLLFTLILLTACRQSLHQPLSATLNLPPWPPREATSPDWPALDFWTVEIYDGSETTTFTLPSESTFLDISISDPYPAAVLVTPVTAGISFFHPAGAVLPSDTEISWQEGFSADLLKKIYLQSENSPDEKKRWASCFNWEKLNQTLAAKALASKINYNPWLLDQEKILSKLNSETFTAASLTLKNCSSFSPEYSCLSSYVPENYAPALNGNFSVRQQVLESFLLLPPENGILTASMDSKGAMSLAINSLPL